MTAILSSRELTAEPELAPALEVTDLHVTFPSEAGDVRAVRGVSFSVRPGEVLGIVGESGSGKSVSSMAVLGLLPETAAVSGSVKLHGNELLGLDDRSMTRIRGKDIAMVFQDPLSALTPVYTVGDQIIEALRIHQDLDKAAARKRTIELLDMVGIPDPARRVDAFPHEFSGGMRQRAVIAMAIANDPKVIIADEPTTALDVTIQAQILDVLKTAQEVTGAAIVVITHDLGVVAGFADRVQVMYAGRPVETGSVDEVYYTPRMPYTIGLLGSIPRLDDDRQHVLTPIDGNPPSLHDLPLGCPFQTRCPIAVDRCREAEPELLATEADAADNRSHFTACHRSHEMAEGGSLVPAEIYPVPEPPQTTAVAQVPREERATVLEIDGLVKHFPLMKGAVFKRQVGTVRAVDGIGFDIREGETLGLVGESGCGKTTTLLEILDLPSGQAGTVTVFGRDIRGLKGSDRKALRRDLQVVFQDPLAALDARMPVGDIIAEPLTTHGWAKNRIAARVPELLRQVGLDPEHAERFPAEFSGGQRQRISIARALALEPKLVILDEPVSALDVSIQAGVLNLLDELKARLGLSYLFVAHDLTVVRHIADRIAVMYLGRIVELGSAESIFEAPSHPYTQALLSAVPLPDPHKERQRKRILLTGDLPSPADVPSGCRFRNRCPKFTALDEAARTRCRDEDPALHDLTDNRPGHSAACHYAAAAAVL
ncbi:dipeptide ABC transporter ATP-binding protein [Streptomyces sp. SID5470]|uniref:Oligopeptide/dipeptide ABC transporter n=1 Tax=Streptomyces sviceus (strain ATCC 29083 / DSM 924 / JCM 4929 / NBRC 13980 / NCIMB 11184 / NRRL 5439 / UC 5370) TaxID=463191 RepID=B5HQV4_STRX2|nr:oligopeptide/dipeptide ABC transporter [Streptomyces sviceus ATCC 29083]MYT05085.1 dipeptide ABC transporter ATP-binding protein [Streptomyces sp. SID5470]